MTRPPRIDFDDARHYVFGRSNQPHLFASDASAQCFVDLLSQLPLRYGVDVCAYAVLPDNYALLLQSRRGQLSDAMRFLIGQCSRSLRSAQALTQSPFAQRFRSYVVDDDEIWKYLISHLHLAPVREGLVRKPAKGAWTSHRYYSGKSTAPSWLRLHETLALFGSHDAYKNFVRDVRVGNIDAPARFARPQDWYQTPKSMPVKTGFATKRLAFALQQVAEITGVSVDDLRISRRGRKGHPARAFAAWWLRQCTGARQHEVGQALHMSTSAVGKAVFSIHSHVKQDTQLAQWKQQLRRQEG